MGSHFIFSDNKELDLQDQILYRGSIGVVPGNISGEDFDFSSNSIYSTNDDIISSMVFNVSDIDRFVDVEQELRHYEAKYLMPSNEFYAKWKSEVGFDKTDFNKWADLYRSLQYAQQ